jgi:hypothetical protein
MSLTILIWGKTMQIKFKRMLSTDSAKAIKADAFGYLNGINYGSPHKSAGVGNMCGNASEGCIANCLGTESGQAAMHKEGESNPVLDSRKRKTVYFMKERKAFMAELAYHNAKLIYQAAKIEKKAASRPNGSWDQAFEAISVVVDKSLAIKISKLIGRDFNAGVYRNLMEAFPELQFVDYTKNLKRLKRGNLPKNYDLTFSLSETNESEAREALALGYNVAAIFEGAFPATYLGKPVIDGDLHDLRFLDPKGGFIVGLTPKGRKIKKDRSGFVIRNYADNNA